MLFRVKGKLQYFVTLCISHGFGPAGLLLKSCFFGGDALTAGIKIPSQGVAWVSVGLAHAYRIN